MGVGSARIRLDGAVQDRLGAESRPLRTIRSASPSHPSGSSGMHLGHRLVLEEGKLPVAEPSLERRQPLPDRGHVRIEPKCLPQVHPCLGKLVPA
jgi:hypothetical protein